MISQKDLRIVNALTSGATIGKLAKNDPVKFSDQFKKLITLIGALAGIKDLPDDLTESLLMEFFTSNLQGFTLEDFRVAFTMNAAGDLHDRVLHFNLLDINFVSQVMDLYLEQKINVTKRIQSLLPEPEVKSMTPDEAYAGLKKYLADHGGEFPEHYSWTLVYRYMEEMLMIPLDMEAKRQLYEDVCRHLKNKIELEILNLKDSKERTRRLEEIPEIAQVECRKILIKKYIKT